MTTESVNCVVSQQDYEDIGTRLGIEQRLRAEVPQTATSSWLEWSCLEALDGSGDQRWSAHLTWSVK